MTVKKSFLIFITTIIFLISNIQFAAAKKNNSPPPTPTGLTISNISTSSLTLSWSSASGASGYYVYMASPNDANYTKIATVTSTNLIKSGLTSNTNYWFYVTAYNRYGTSTSSIHVTAATLQASIIPTTSKKQILGFTTYYYSGDSSSYNSMAANTSTIDEIATQTYTTDSLGNISGLVPTNQISYANSNGIKTYAMLQNNFDGNIAKSVLENQTNRQKLENNLLNAIKVNGYKGVNVDLEGVFYYDRNYYTTFVQELYNLLTPQGFSVTLSVPAKTSDSTTNSWSGAYDYAALAKYCDQIAIMTYDEHYPGGTAGPIASISWVENVIKYAVTVIPREKIMLGVAAYGYDWSSNGTKAYGINGMYNIAAANNASILWDNISKSPYFNYTDTSGIAHSNWFENGQSLGYKLDLVNSYNLNGIAIWRLGLENADYWTSIKTKFNR
ncbi:MULTISPECIES: glycosyl hydrolase family 18 protein [Clostridium]|uniref:Spore germination protein YaaH n=1 Tax=Clostridium ragsdalei P11 TaxID=1353534 RepID=A0A1A6AHV8_9CLOT|nr:MULTISPECIES: glycosyl hydrolase family 18 protein [Clostridium]OBR89660.1 spore germination protein YaaH [Clostridium ragsdalei P11]QXE21073.1 chitinase [Clostridium sp. 001]